MTVVDESCSSGQCCDATTTTVAAVAETDSAAAAATTEQIETPVESTATVDELIQQIQEIQLTTTPPVVEEQKKCDKEATTFAPEITVSKEIRQLAQWIHDSDHILVVTGAGVSCAAGIPDFRSPGTGLYDILQQYDLPFPEAVFDLDFFRRKPLPFVSLVHALWPSKHVPTYTHSFLAMMAHTDKRKLLRNYSQNIDGLEFLAGMPAEHLIECHGHFRSSSCINCKRPCDQSRVETDILQHSRPTKCTHCNGLVKPDIVFFGEGLPARFHLSVNKDVRKADLCLVIGTSLQVAPVNMIPDMVGCKVALVNRDSVGTNVDLFCQGDCDEIIRDLALALGWHDELEERHDEMVRKMKEENGKVKMNGDKSGKKSVA